MISKETIEQLKEKSDIVSLIQERVVLRKQGSGFVGLCPFHAERTPSFHVMPEKRFFYCFGCQKYGDALGFLMESQSLSFIEAVQELALRVNMPLNFTEGHPEQRAKTAIAYRLNRFVLGYFQANLEKHPDAQNYLLRRGVSMQHQDFFCLGLAEGGWDGLTLYLREKKAPLETAIELGLLRQKKNLDLKDHFVSRVIFPIINLQGKVAGFAGRLLQEAADAPKYLNSSESVIFDKSRLLFGLFQTHKYIRACNEAIVVEGYTDLIGLYAAGFKNVVATCGTALTLGHLEQLQKICSKITVLYDGDTAGRLASEKAMRLGLQQGLILYGAQIPEGKDPNDLLVNPVDGSLREDGIIEMRNILGVSQPLVDTKLHVLFQNDYLHASDLQAKLEGARKIGQLIESIADPTSRKMREHVVLNRYRIPAHLLQLGAYRSVSKSTDVQVQKKKNSFSLTDQCFFVAILYGGSCFHKFMEVVADLPFEVWDFFVADRLRLFVEFLFKDARGIQFFQRSTEKILEDCTDLDIRDLLLKRIVVLEEQIDLPAFGRMLNARRDELLRQYADRLFREGLKDNANNMDMDFEVLKKLRAVARLRVQN